MHERIWKADKICHDKVPFYNRSLLKIIFPFALCRLGTAEYYEHMVVCSPLELNALHEVLVVDPRTAQP